MNASPKPLPAAGRLAWRWVFGPIAWACAAAGAGLLAAPTHTTGVSGAGAARPLGSATLRVSTAADASADPAAAWHGRALRLGLLGPALDPDAAFTPVEWRWGPGCLGLWTDRVTARGWREEHYERPVDAANPPHLTADATVGLPWAIAWFVLAAAAWRRARGGAGDLNPPGLARRLGRAWVYTAAAVGAGLLFVAPNGAGLPVAAWAGREPVDSPHLRGLLFAAELSGDGRNEPVPARAGAGPGWRWSARPPHRARPGGGTDVTLHLAAWWLAAPPLLANALTLAAAARRRRPRGRGRTAPPGSV